jgi:acetyl esterase/lipase
MIRKQTLAYKPASGTDIHADVYRPDGASPLPGILWLHGGGLIFGDRTAIAPDQLERYLGAGFVVVSADYRLAPETKLDVIIEDLQDAYAWVRHQGPSRFGIDRDRISVVGHSAGGYLTLMSGFRVDPRPRALVSFYGYGDIVGSWYSRPDPHYCREPEVPQRDARRAVRSTAITGVPFDSPAAARRWRFYLYCRQHGLWPREVAGHDPEEEPSWFEPYCPLRSVGPDYPPTMLIHGDRDTDVPFEQSMLMARELERQGLEHELLALEGRGHRFDGVGLSEPLVAAVFDRVLSFLKTHSR